jgi:hypothetical protein
VQNVDGMPVGPIDTLALRSVARIMGLNRPWSAIMLDKTQIEELEKAMLEEHRLDLEALNRLKRFLPANGANAKQVSGKEADTAAHAEPGPLPRATNAMPARPADKKVPSDHDLDEDLQDIGTLRGKVGEVMASDPERSWTGERMLTHLRVIGFPLRAQRPSISIVTAMTYWVKRDFAHVVRKGVGRAPNIVRWKADKAFPGPQKEESEVLRKSA